MLEIKGFLDGLKPEPRITVSEWADKHRYLSPVAAAEPGLWRTSRTPYLKQIMDDLSAYSPVQEVVVMKGAQLGFTEAGNNWIGYIIDSAPAPTLMVQPTDEMVKRNSKMRIDTMVEATPRLREKIAPARSRDSNNTVNSKSFPGGILVMSGANSASGLRSMPAKNLMLDETDAYPLDLDGEGSPIDLAEARTRTFARRKIYKVSTPTLHGQSVIEAAFLKTCQQYFFVPCPDCGHMQPLHWSNLKWDKGKPETARYFCEECGVGIEERHKTRMLAQGEWVATSPENVNQSVKGYHINSLYSPNGWYSWSQAAKDWEDAQGDTPKLKTFINTVLGETWKEEGEAPAWENLYNRRSAYSLNKPSNEVAFLTAGVDIQKDRIELEIVGWCNGKHSYSIDYRVLLGDTSSTAVWDDLAKVVDEQFEREDGAIMPLRLMAVDTGYNTSEVYTFCRRFDQNRVIPIKGQDSLGLIVSAPRAVDTNRRGKKINKTKVWNVGTSVIKSELYGWLRQEIKEDGTVPKGYCYFPQYDQRYFKGLTAEELQFRLVKGFRKYEWIKKYERNEPLDCRVYARAAASVVGMDRMNDEQFAKILSEYQRKPVESQKEKRKSSFWNR